METINEGKHRLDILTGDFGHVEWGLDDLREALELMDRDPDKNIAALVNLMAKSEHHSGLVSAMIDTGWNYIYGVIENNIPVEED